MWVWVCAPASFICTGGQVGDWVGAFMFKHCVRRVGDAGDLHPPPPTLEHHPRESFKLHAIAMSEWPRG